MSHYFHELFIPTKGQDIYCSISLYLWFFHFHAQFTEAIIESLEPCTAQNGEAMERDRVDKAPSWWQRPWQLDWRVWKFSFHVMCSISEPVSFCCYYLLLCRWSIQNLNQSLRHDSQQLFRWFCLRCRRVWSWLWWRMWWLTFVYYLIKLYIIITSQSVLWN